MFGDRGARTCLVGGHPRQVDPELVEHRLHEAGAVDPVLGVGAAPDVGDAELLAGLGDDLLAGRPPVAPAGARRRGTWPRAAGEPAPPADAPATAGEQRELGLDLLDPAGDVHTLTRGPPPRDGRAASGRPTTSSSSPASRRSRSSRATLGPALEQQLDGREPGLVPLPVVAGGRGDGAGAQQRLAGPGRVGRERLVRRSDREVGRDAPSVFGLRARAAPPARPRACGRPPAPRRGRVAAPAGCPARGRRARGRRPASRRPGDPCSCHQLLQPLPGLGEPAWGRPWPGGGRRRSAASARARRRRRGRRPARTRRSRPARARRGGRPASGAAVAAAALLRRRSRRRSRGRSTRARRCSGSDPRWPAGGRARRGRRGSSGRCRRSGRGGRRPRPARCRGR